MKKIIALGLVAAAMAVSACNTVAGVGRDVQAAGSAVTGAANDAKNSGPGRTCSHYLHPVILGLDPRIRRGAGLREGDGPASVSILLDGAPDGLALGSSPRVTVMGQ